MVSRLDLKYRPKKFHDVLGNEGILQLLLARSKAGTLTNQSMLFGGPKGTGKTTLARIVAMATVCKNKQDGEPCGSCSSCASILNETSTCVEELDAASQGTVDRIREMVHDSEYETIDGIANVYILDEAQRLSQASQDAMLKAIEDRSIIVIMCTTEPHKIRASIRSRVEEYPVSSPSTDTMVERLALICDNEGLEYDKNALELLSKASQNCPRICIRSIETVSILGPVNSDSMKKFLRFESYEIVNKVLSLIDDSPKTAIQAYDDLIDQEGPVWVRDAMLFAVSSGLRIDVGANHTYPCKVSFFQTRLRNWSEFARQIGMMERPTSSGILSALIATRPDFLPSGVKNVTAVNLNTPMTVSSPPEAVPSPPEAVPSPPETSLKNAGLEIEGIKFSSDEHLTTLDGKIEVTVKQDLVEESSGVEYRSDMVPMSDREFVRDFINRVKKS